MNERELKPQQSQTEDPPLSEKERFQDTQPKDKKPTHLTEDADYQRIKDEINKQWLERTWVKPLSGDHQDYLFGNPIDRNATTLEQDTERVFREQFTDRATKYDENEHVRAYDKIGDDPAYRELQEQITIRTNADSQVQAASKTGQDWAGIWDRVNTREHIHGMNDFARQYPEKAQAYTDRWNGFVDENPEIAHKNNAEWQTWCDNHPGAFYSMSECRNLARAVEHLKRRREIDRVQPQVHESETKLNELRANLGIEAPQPTDSEKTPLARQKEQLNSLQLEEVVSEIRARVPAEVQTADREALQAMQKELAELPYVPMETVWEVLKYTGDDEGVVMVDTDDIVGSVSPAFENWSTEYGSRKGRVVAVAQELMKGTSGAVDEVFHITDPSSGVKLKKISGPGGDLFFVVDGTHRVAGSKLARLPELPAQVENVTELSEVHTTDPALKLQWTERIKRGLIRGSIEDVTTSLGQKRFNLKIDSQVLPWMHLPQDKLIKLTKFYFERYPKALDDMKSFRSGEKIPKEALLDDAAMDLYLADHWDNHKPKE